MRNLIWSLAVSLFLVTPIFAKEEIVKEVNLEELGKVDKDNKNVCVIERGGEKYRLEFLEKQTKMTVADQDGMIVTISYSSGNYSIRLPNGWGYWRSTIGAAVDSAIGLFSEAQGQRTQDEARQEMVKYVEDAKMDK